MISLAQLSAPGMSAVRYTAYPSAPGVSDPVFIYCNSTGTQKGTIQALSQGGTGPFDFSWYRWSDITRSFSIFLKTDAVPLQPTLMREDTESELLTAADTIKVW
jgi:hypothetical protein